MFLSPDKSKLMLGRIGELRSRIDTANRELLRRLQEINTDTTRSDSWKGAQAALATEDADATIAAAVREAQEIRGKALAARRFWDNPSMILLDSRMEGALWSNEAAARAEFRAVVSPLDEAARRDWFEVLAEAKDWARLGVLLSVAPELNKDALKLDLPGRGEGIRLADMAVAEVSAVLQEEHAQRGNEELAALHAKHTLTGAETTRMLKLADQAQKGWPSEYSTPATPVTLTDEERAEYHALNKKTRDGFELTPSEGHRLVSLAGRLEVGSMP